MNIMDNEDSNGSGPAESNASSGGTRKSPKCGRCLSHGLVIDLKGHKRYCKRRNCYCDKCVITLTRRKRMAKKTYQDRARKQDEYKRNQGEVPDEQVAPLSFEDSNEFSAEKRKETNLKILINHSLHEMKDLRLAGPLMALATTIIEHGHENATKADITKALDCISRVSIIRHAKNIHRCIKQNVILSFLVNLFPP